VYVCRAILPNQSYLAVVNIGTRPTFAGDPSQTHIEAHLLDFDRDLYGQTLALEFLARLRDEQRFASAEALVTQIQADIYRARQIGING
jgi:riboflavin kinase/FMN adenylyltransferase